VQFLEDQQLENVERGFEAIMERLKEKKQSILAEMTVKYGAEKRKLNQGFREVVRDDESLKEIEEAY